MGGFSLWHWLIVGLVILLLFGKGRFSDMMGDVAKGLKSFKKGMSEEDEVPPAAAPRRLSDERIVDPAPPAAASPAAEAASGPAERGSASEADRH
jgi:sec-independent protein translocase protein TatA